MTNRIVLDNNGIKISKATFDVLTESNINNYILNATSNVGAGVFMSGSITGVSTYTVNFGTTFSYIPFTLVYTVDGAGTSYTSGVNRPSLINRYFSGTVSNTNLVFPNLHALYTYHYAIFYMKAR